MQIWEYGLETNYTTSNPSSVSAAESNWLGMFSTILNNQTNAVEELFMILLKLIINGLNNVLLFHK